MFHLYYNDLSTNKPFWNHFCSTTLFEDAVKIREEEADLDVLIVYSEKDMSSVMLRDLDYSDWYEGEDGEYRLK